MPIRRAGLPLLLLLLATVGMAPGSDSESGQPSPSESPRNYWLFIGNSLLQKHDVQDLVAGIAQSIDGRAPVVERVTLGGATLESHVERSDDGAPLTRLEAEPWEVVVIQPNGRLAMTERSQGLEPYALRPARTLVAAIRARALDRS